jgi:tRNA-specific 2-thiouridylase
MNAGGKKVYVGLSGGVDSATSAALLLKDGYEVTGVFIKITVEGYPCTAGEDRLDAMRAAAHLKIPFVEIDLSKEYQERVFAESIREFERGHTPNPDALCNREIKFGLFYEWTRAQGADMVATGHYAKVASKNPQKGRDERAPDSLFGDFVELHVAADKEKDQSYFLWAVPQEVLAHMLFPIGHLEKPQVRKLAESFGLPNAGRKDSQGLCFLGPISVGDMLKKELHPIPGTVLDEEGAVVGTHEGVMLYTMGQRHGFVLAKQGPHAMPHYVIAKDLAENTITVSENKFPAGAAKTKLSLTEMNWIGPTESGPCDVRYRYRQELIAAELDAKSGTVTLHEPHYAPVGQSLVAYKQGRCLGGGVIKEVSVY